MHGHSYVPKVGFALSDDVLIGKSGRRLGSLHLFTKAALDNSSDYALLMAWDDNESTLFFFFP